MADWSGLTPEQADVVLARLGTRCVGIERIRTGLINPLYVLSTTDGREVILKAVPSLWKHRKTTNEAALMRFVRHRTTIPVPLIHHYDAEGLEIGTEYILMEKAEGRPLSELWRDVVREDRFDYLDQLAGYIAQIRQFEFDKIGGFGEDMQVGPDPDSDIGPFTSLSEYLAAKLTMRIEEMRCDPAVSSLVDPFLRFRDGISQYSGNCRFVLTHNDLHLKNVLVDGGKITAILDWEWAISAPEDLEFHQLSGELTAEETAFLLERLARYGHVKADGFDERADFFLAARIALSLAAYKRWYVETPEEGEKMRDRAMVRARDLLQRHGSL